MRIEAFLFLSLLPRTAGFEPATIIVQQWLSIAVRLLAALENQVAGGLECDARIKIVAHAAIIRVSGVLIVDDRRHASASWPYADSRYAMSRDPP